MWNQPQLEWDMPMIKNWDIWKIKTVASMIIQICGILSFTTTTKDSNPKWMSKTHIIDILSSKNSSNLRYITPTDFKKSGILTELNQWRRNFWNILYVIMHLIQIEHLQKRLETALLIFWFQNFSFNPTIQAIDSKNVKKPQAWLKLLRSTNSTW